MLKVDYLKICIIDKLAMVLGFDIEQFGKCRYKIISISRNILHIKKIFYASVFFTTESHKNNGHI